MRSMPFLPRKATSVLIFFSFLILSGCLSVPSASQRLATADSLAKPMGFIRARIFSNGFQMTIFYKITSAELPLRVYIEGDGYAWITRYRVSGDPTPKFPTALSLAVLDASSNVAYIARPCQYKEKDVKDACRDDYWTGSRFAEEVIVAVDEIVSRMKEKASAKEIEMVGYSGGGAVAALIAARRSDVVRLITVAGNLDPNGLCEYHGVSMPDFGALDPMDVAVKLGDVPQTHFVGGKDKVVPKIIADNFVSALPRGTDVKIKVAQNATHSEGWDKVWRELLEEY